MNKYMEKHPKGLKYSRFIANKCDECGGHGIEYLAKGNPPVRVHWKFAQKEKSTNKYFDRHHFSTECENCDGTGELANASRQTNSL